MRGDLISTWEHALREVWSAIQAGPTESDYGLDSNREEYEGPQDDVEVHSDLFAALYQDAFEAFTNEIQEEVGFRGRAVGSDFAAAQFLGIRGADFESELKLVRFYEGAFETLSEYDEYLSKRYVKLLKNFVSKYNLRYEVDAGGHLTPTIPGLFASLFEEISGVGDADDDVAQLLRELRHAYGDLRTDKSEPRIKAYVHRLINLVEAIATKHPQATRNTLGAVCPEICSWPHAAIQRSLSSLYGFASDYPGIRHAGNSVSQLRDLDMRDVVALTVLCAGFTPYLIDQIDCEQVYLPVTRA